MSREYRWPGIRWSSGLALMTVGAVLASLVWLLVVVPRALTPSEAQARRAEPTLQPATAQVSLRVLRQRVWSDCAPRSREVGVAAPRVNPQFRSLVTAISRRGARVATGDVVARVADVPLAAVVSDHAVLYRDLPAGAQGDDVEAFTEALAAAGLARSSSTSLSAATVDMWAELVPGGVVGHAIQWESLVVVPRDAAVSAVFARRGAVVANGTRLLTVTARSGDYVCPVSGLQRPPRAPELRLMSGDGQVSIRSVLDVVRKSGEITSIVVTPSHPLSSQTVRLGISVTSAERGAVLAVPMRAVRNGSDGRPVVTTLDAGSATDVTVTLGATAQGWIEVRAEQLSPGDVVELFG